MCCGGHLADGDEREAHAGERFLACTYSLHTIPLLNAFQEPGAIKAMALLMIKTGNPRLVDYLDKARHCKSGGSHRIVGCRSKVFDVADRTR